MPYRTIARRVKTGALADDAPNATAPSADQIVSYLSFKLDANQQAKGWVWYVRFLDAAGSPVAGASARVTPWVLDTFDGVWASAESDANVVGEELYQTAHYFPGCDLFFQLTDIVGVGIATIEVRLGSF